VGKEFFDRALVFCNGEFSPESVPRLRANDLVICADGGLEHAMSVGIEPHVVLGDFDSLSGAHQRYLNQAPTHIKIYEYPIQKDKTDGQLAVEYALDTGVREIWMFGGLGGRFDHTLGNLLLCWLCLGRGVAMQLVGHRQYVRMLNGPDSTDLRGRPGDYVSLLPLTPTVVGVTTTGLYYPLQENTLYLGDTRGLSNELITAQAKVEVRDGILVVIGTERNNELPS